MKDNFDTDFDAHFARDLGRIDRRAQPETADWDQLAQRLDATEQRWSWRWVWIGLLPLLLISNGWMWWRLNHLPTGTATPVVAPSSATVEQPAHVKTVVYDTIYRTVVVTRIVEETRPVLRTAAVDISSDPAPAEGHNQFSPNTVSEGTQPDITAPTEPSSTTPSATNQPSAPSSANPTENTPKVSVIPDTVLASSATTAGPIAAPVLPTAETPAQPDTTLTTAILPPTEVHHAPIKVRIGLSAGGAIPLSEHYFQHTHGLSSSVLFDLERGHWGLISGLSYQTFEYQTMRGFDPRLGIDPPVSPGSQYVLRSITGKNQQLIPYLGVQYRLRPEKRLSFALGAGYALRLLKTGTTKYTFEHGSTGADYAYRSHSKPWMTHHSAFVQGQVALTFKGRWSVFGNWTGLFDEHSLPVSAAQLGIKRRLF